MNSFYVTLISDSSPQTYPNNKLYDFTTKLSRFINLDKENWEVALVEINHPSQILNINEIDTHFYLSTHSQSIGKLLQTSPHYEYSHGTHRVKCKIKPGVYSESQHILYEINNSVQKCLKTFILNKELVLKVLYTYGSQSPKIYFSLKDNTLKGDVGIEFSDSLFNKLGGDVSNNKIIYSKSTNPFPYKMDLNEGSDQLLIYTDVIEYTFLGDIEAPILRIIPFEATKETSFQINREFKHQHYIPLSKSSFDEIHVFIRGTTGLPIHFVSGKTIVKLHFRKRFTI